MLVLFFLFKCKIITGILIFIANIDLEVINMSKNKIKKTLFISAVILFGFLTYYNQLNQTAENNFALADNSNNLEAFASSSSEKEKSKIIVHLTGEVNNAGIYSLNEDARLVDLIKAAGGLKEKADLKQINLAENIFDGQKIIIPQIIAENDYSTESQLGKENLSFKNLYSYNSKKSNDLININKAAQSELEKLTGVGPSKASAMIKYREENGRFIQKEDLLKINGIGEKTFANIKNEIRLR